MLPSPGAETTPVFFSTQYSHSCPPVKGRSSLPSPLYIFSPGFLITGGLPNTKVVELMVPSLDRRCILPELPGPVSDTARWARRCAGEATVTLLGAGTTSRAVTGEL